MATTPNKGYQLPTVGGDAGLWGTELNNNVISIIDTNLGGVQAISAAAGSATMTPTQMQNQRFAITGTLASNITLTFPSTAGGNGTYVIDNASSGAFSITIATSIPGAASVVIPQGARSLISGDGTNFNFADDSRTAAFDTQLGTPQGQVAGTAGAANRAVTNAEWDATNRVLYAATTTGTVTTAVWTPVYSNAFTPQGYLTPVTGTPIITGDSLAATTLYYTPYQGNWTFLSNGTTVYPYQFSEISYGLTNALLASNIYDVFIYNSSVGPLIGTGPSWALGSGGSVTAGACARGTGTAGTALTRLKGVLTNASTGLTFTTSVAGVLPPATNQAVYLGSMFIDTTPGQVTCHRSYGQSCKWGIWNAYNRANLLLQGGDGTANWAYNTNTIRPSNNNSNNVVTGFSGLAEELTYVSFTQNVGASTVVGANRPSVAIGKNTTGAVTGTRAGAWGGGSGGQTITVQARYDDVTPLGINNYQSLESGGGGTGGTFYGTQTDMLLRAEWRG